MCTLALYNRVSQEMPLLVAANRDEFHERASAAPAPICRDPWVVAGRDLVAGGTWLGLNQYGLIAAILNRRTQGGPDPARRSRGLLCLEALQSPSLQAACERLQAEESERYNPFTLVLADRNRAVVALGRGDGPVALHELPEGVHVLSNLDVNDPACPRIAAARPRFAATAPPPGRWNQAALAPLRAILSDHRQPGGRGADTPEDSLCIHRGPYGTRSSTIIGLPSEGSARYWHAEGAPCVVPYSAVDLAAR